MTAARSPADGPWALRLTLGLLVLALLVHGVAWLQHRDDPFAATPVSDALSYHVWAERIAERGLAEEPVFHQAPLYPLLLAAVYRLVDPPWRATAAIWIQIVLGSLAVAALVPLARAYLRSTAAGAAAAALALLHAPVVFHSLKLLPVTLALATQALALLGVAAVRRRPQVITALLCGGALGLACLARSEILLFVPVALWCVTRADDAAGSAAARWRRPATAFWCLAGFALAVAPVTAHNVRRGDLVWIASSAGENLYVGNQRGADGGHTPLHPRAVDLFSQRAVARAAAEEARGRPLSASQVDRYWRGRAWDEVRADPAGWLALELRKLGRLFHPGDPTDMYSLPLERSHYLSVLYLLPLAPVGLWVLGVGGAWLAIRRVGSRAWPLLGLIVVHFTVLLAFFVSSRLRVPLMFWLAPFAGFAVVQVVRHAVAGRRLGWAAALTTLLVLDAAHWTFVLRPGARDAVRLASVLSVQERYHESLAVLEPWLREPRPDPLALDQAGWVRSKRGEPEAAARLYLRALELGLPTGREAQTRSRLAILHERLGQATLAREQHDAAVHAAPHSAFARYERGLFLLRQGDTAAAIEDLRAAARLEPQWSAPAEALRSLGQLAAPEPSDAAAPRTAPVQRQ